jgi:predicted flap endonuclease-1-like 5' DNA nuclease
MLEVSNVKPWINEDIFKSWTDAQKRLWESLCSAVPFQPPAGVEAWRETYLKNLATWESAVKKTLQQEANWVEQWVHKVANEQGTPEIMASWVQQMEDVLQRWIQTQNQWWDEYFAVLRRGGFAYPDWANPPSSPVEPAVEKKPVKAPKSQVKAAPESPPVEPVAKVKPAPPPEPAPVEVALEPAPVEAAPKPALVRMPDKPVRTEPDDLKLISGIGPALEKKLNACGISRYQELATLSDADIDRVEAAIKSFGRIRRDDWIGQAKARHFEKYQEQI